MIRYKFSTADTIFCVLIHKYIQHMATFRLILFFVWKEKLLLELYSIG